jgi:hypothetical protein
MSINFFLTDETVEERLLRLGSIHGLPTGIGRAINASTMSKLAARVAHLPSSHPALLCTSPCAFTTKVEESSTVHLKAMQIQEALSQKQGIFSSLEPPKKGFSTKPDFVIGEPLSDLPRHSTTLPELIQSAARGVSKGVIDLGEVVHDTITRPSHESEDPLSGPIQRGLDVATVLGEFYRQSSELNERLEYGSPSLEEIMGRERPKEVTEAIERLQKPFLNFYEVFKDGTPTEIVENAARMIVSVKCELPTSVHPKHQEIIDRLDFELPEIPQKKDKTPYTAHPVLEGIGLGAIDVTRSIAHTIEHPIDTITEMALMIRDGTRIGADLAGKLYAIHEFAETHPPCETDLIPKRLREIKATTSEEAKAAYRRFEPFVELLAGIISSDSADEKYRNSARLITNLVSYPIVARVAKRRFSPSPIESLPKKNHYRFASNGEVASISIQESDHAIVGAFSKANLDHMPSDAALTFVEKKVGHTFKPVLFQISKEQATKLKTSNPLIELEGNYYIIIK